MRSKGKYKQAKTAEEYLAQRVCWVSSGCLEWQKGKDKDGYGQCHAAAVAKKYKVTRAHQLAYVSRHGAIPPGMFVCHTCDNPSCCNIDHLFLGSPKDNVHDMLKKGRAKPPCGEDSGNSKLKNCQVLEIRDKKGKSSCLEVAKEYEISFSLVAMIWRRDIWRHV